MDFKDFLASNAFDKVNLNDDTNNECSLAEVMGYNQNFWSYVINPIDYKIAYISPNILFDLPEVKVGDVCFCNIMDRKEPCENCPLNLSDENSGVEIWIEKLGGYFNISAKKVIWANKEELIIMQCYRCNSI